jgi:hypothetical protein
MLIMLSFLAGIAATLTAIRLSPIVRNSQLVDLALIALRNRWTAAPTRSAPRKTPEQMQEEKERAMAAGLPTN